MNRCMLAMLVMAFFGLTLVADESPKELPENLREILAKSESIELLSLEPRPTAEELNSSKDKLWGDVWIILGKTTIRDAKIRKKVIDAVFESVGGGRGGPKCFDPRHVVTATHDGKKLAILLCYECGWAAVTVNEKEPIEGLWPLRKNTQSTLDEVLKASGVKLARKGNYNADSAAKIYGEPKRKSKAK